MTRTMTEGEAHTLARNIHDQYGWLVEVDHLKGQPADRPTPFFVRVHAPASLPTMQPWAQFGRSIYSLDEHIRLFCPSGPDYAWCVAQEALAALPSGTRQEWLTLADDATLYFWRSYRGHHYDGSQTLTGAATVMLLPAGSHDRCKQHLRPGWTDEQFMQAVARLLSQHMARPEWEKVKRLLHAEAMTIREEVKA